eukprot:215796-Rhodomonas_salina.1
MVYVPPLSFEFASAGECAWYASLFLAVLAPVTLHAELSGQNSGYSKFTSNGPDKSVPIPTRVGMFFLYFCPLIVALAVHFSAVESSTYNNVVVLNIAAHFVKRIAEVLFVHKYSGSMNVNTTILIALVYCLHSFANSYTAQYDMPLEHQPSSWQQQVGFLVLWFGEFGTVYYHNLLANLRQPGDKRYKVPSGGLFKYVCCPHYLFELIAFIGLAILSNHVVGITTVISMTGYLLGRSAATLKWYQEKAKAKTFDTALPQSWHAMVPGICQSVLTATLRGVAVSVHTEHITGCPIRHTPTPHPGCDHTLPDLRAFPLRWGGTPLHSLKLAVFKSTLIMHWHGFRHRMGVLESREDVSR